MAPERFDRILADIEGRHAHEEQEQLRAVSEELTRAERAQVTLLDRLRGAVGQIVTVHPPSGPAVRGEVAEVGEDWVHLRAGGSRVLVPRAGIVLVEGLSPRSRPARDGAVPGLSFLGMLRHLSRDRELVHVQTAVGRVTGRVAAVGADAVDVITRPTGEAGTARGASRTVLDAAAIQLVHVP